MRLTADTDPEAVAQGLRPVRAGEPRRQELERLAGLCAPRAYDIHVRLVPTGAACRPREEPGAYEIRIPTKRYEQVHTDLPPAAWDRLMQVTLLFHELGHVLYSGFGRYYEYQSDVDSRWQYLFKTVYNAAEDAAIEAQLAAEFRLERDFRIKSRTLSTIADRRHEEFVELFDLAEAAEPVQQYTLYEALRLALIDRGTIDSGRFAELRDPDCDRRSIKGDHEAALTTIDTESEAYMGRMLSEPDPAARVDLAYEFFETVRPVFEATPPLQRRRLQTTAVRPDDVVATSNWSPGRADRLAGRSGGRSRSGPASGSGSGGLVRPDADTDEPLVDPTTPGSGADVIDARQGRHRGGAGGGNGQTRMRREVSNLVDLVTDDSTPVEEVRVAEPASDGGERWPELRASGRRLEEQLRTRLRRERRPQATPGTRQGRIDNRRLVAATQGSDRVFSRTTPGAEKDYSCQLVLDRSGSMASRIAAAEDAVGQLTAALYAVGVDVSVLSLYESIVNLELPFGVDPAACADRILTGRIAGQTPLADAITLTRHRLGHGEGTVPFVVVVTDGHADDIDAYQRQVDRCHCPVYGIYLDDERDHGTYFDRVVYASTDTVEPTLRDLVRNVFREGA